MSWFWPNRERELKEMGGKCYSNSARDVRGSRRNEPYEPTASVKRLALRDEIDRLERRRAREKARAVQGAIEAAHIEARDATRLNGKPPRDLLVEFEGEIYSSHDPKPISAKKGLRKK
jgi:hypothetical protein